MFNQVESPLVKILTAMEFEGVNVDVSFLKDYSVELEKEADRAEKNVYEKVGNQAAEELP